MNTTIEIVDRGKGPQLSTSRITVQDLLPYLRAEASHEEIRRWMPSLSEEEIVAVEQYIDEHYDEVMRAEKQIKAFHDRLRAAQPAWTRRNDHLSLEKRRSLLYEKLSRQGAKDSRANDSA